MKHAPHAHLTATTAPALLQRPGPVAAGTRLELTLRKIGGQREGILQARPISTMCCVVCWSSLSSSSLRAAALDGIDDVRVGEVLRQHDMGLDGMEQNALVWSSIPARHELTLNTD